MKWFSNEGKYCLLFYLMMAICFGMGYVAGAAYLTTFWCISLTIAILVSCVVLSSYMMILDYQRYKALQAVQAALAQNEASGE